MELDSEEWETTEQMAYDAIRGANNWLVALRNAEDEGWDPWSDYFTTEMRQWEDESTDESAEETGIVSYSEGLTAISLTNQFAHHDGFQTWNSLQSDKYSTDIETLVGWILDGDEPGYRPAPYLPPDLTNHFTDAVSFSTSALLGALESDITLEGEVTVDDVKRTVVENIEWLLDRTVESEEGNLGWSWAGTADGETPPAQSATEPYKYFTYSGCVALTDVLASEEIQAEIDDPERIRATLSSAKDYLVAEDWEGMAWSNVAPGAVGNIKLATCYTIVATSYMAKWGAIDLDSESVDEVERVQDAFGWLWDNHLQLDARIQNLPELTEEYELGDFVYTDSSGPYLFLETVIEILEFLDTFDRDFETIDRTAVENRKHELARYILNQLWAGDSEYKIKGFRHVGKGNKDPTVIYTTQTAIDTMLKYLSYPDPEEMEEYRPGERSATEASDVPDSGGTTSTDGRRPSPGAGGGKNYNFYFVDDAGGGAGSEMVDELRSIREDIRELRSTDTGKLNEEVQIWREARRYDDPAEYDQKKKEGTMKWLKTEGSKGFDSLAEAIKNTPMTPLTRIYNDDQEGIRSIHTDTFVEIIQECWHGDVDDSIQAYISRRREANAFLKQWDEVLAEIEELSDEVLDDDVARRVAIREALKGSLEDGLKKQDEYTDQELEAIIEDVDARLN